MPSNHDNAHPAEHAKPANSRAKWIFFGFAAISAFLLLVEHRVHVFGALPYLLLLACPLMHLFHHGGHRDQGGHGGETGDKTGGEPK